MITRPEIRMSRLLSVDQGKQMELSAEIDGVIWQLASVVADDKDESLWVQVYAGEHIVQVPLQTVQALLDAAREEVRSEAWFIQNVYPEINQA